MPYLVQKGPDGATLQSWNLHSGAMTIGRGEESNAQVNDDRLSRKHFTITENAGKFVLKDLGSKNGTRVNGALVTEQALKANDEIQAGGSVFVVTEGLTTLWMKSIKT